jgi:hypothetical protein
MYINEGAHDSSPDNGAIEYSVLQQLINPYLDQINWLGGFTGNFTLVADTDLTFPSAGILATIENLSAYLPLSGGTLSGVLNANAQVNINSALVFQSDNPATITPKCSFVNNSSGVVWVMGDEITSDSFRIGRTTALTSLIGFSIDPVSLAIDIGIWNGSIISPAYGGTGVDNGAFTLTLGGSAAFIGAFTSAFTFTANTAVTFPIAGTLATTANLASYLPLAGGAVVGSITNTNNYLFQPTAVVSTMSQTGILATIAGVSSSLASAYVVPATGSPFTIVSYQGTTTVPTNVSQTIAPGTACTLYYFPNSVNFASALDSGNSGFGSFISLFTNIRYLALGTATGTYLNLPNAGARTLSITSSLATAPNNSSNQTASQSTTTVTGVGTSWDSTYIGHMIRFSTGSTAFITAVGSTTSMTVTPSQTVAATAFDIPGKTTSFEATSMDALGNFGTNSAYVRSLASFYGGEVHAVTSVTAATYTTLTTDFVLACNRAGTIAITLISSPVTGRTYRIKDISGAANTNNITITPASGTIDGAANYVINTNYGSIDMVYNGSEWSVL